MKFFNGKACKRPYRKTPLVIGIVLLSVSLATFFLFFSVTLDSESTTDSSVDPLMAGFISSCTFFIPGLILFIIGMTKKIKNSNEYKKAQSVDYEAWRAEHLNNPNDPLFSVNCTRCNGLIEYDFRGIDGTRFWYSNGFVVCPQCNTIMRHNAKTTNAAQQQTSPPSAHYCLYCGAALPPNSNFCVNCGNKT